MVRHLEEAKEKSDQDRHKILAEKEALAVENTRLQSIIDNDDQQDLADTNKDLELQIDEKDAEIQHLKNIIFNLNLRVDEFLENNSNLEQEYKQEQTQFQEKDRTARETIQTLRFQIQNITEEKETLEVIAGELQTQLETLQETNKQLTRERYIRDNDSEQKTNELLTTIDTLTDKISRLQLNLDTMIQLKKV
ncbi:hypothetical protein WMY93_001113 [Mugilogobius chulae]|uniref:Uncharacterized protein n=1 Tax=Mugilogobius chulae TaxID=88201 RepID=A0AAW0QC00_9GOBI